MAVNYNYEVPSWMRFSENSFADALAKGAQVGAAIANARYRNQALAVQAIQDQREFALREKQLAAHNRTADLNFQLQSQLVADQTDDKAAITDWIQQRNQMPLEERLSMDLPSLRLPQSYQIANQIVDNDRLTFERSLKGKTQNALALRLSKLPADFIQRFEMEEDWDSKMQILAEGEEAARTATLDLYQPREMTTSEGETLFYNPKTGTFRFAPDSIADEVKTRPVTDEAGNVIGHAMWSGDKWVRIPKDKGGNELDIIRYRQLQSDLSDIRKMKAGPLGTSPKLSPGIQAQEDALRKELQEIESRVGKPSSAAPKKDPLGLFE